MSRNAPAPAPRQAPKAAKPGRRIAFLLLFLVVSVFGIQMGSAWYNDKYGPMGGYNLLGLNYRETAIPSYWVNGVWGGNLFAGSPNGGGGSTCCLTLDRSSKTARVEWQVGRSREEIDTGKPIEFRFKEVQLPNITNPKNGYLGVHFLPQDEIKITFQEFSAKPLIPIKEIDYGFSLFDDVKQDDFEKNRMMK